MKTLDADRRKALNEKLLEHLEAAQAVADELAEPIVQYLVERALDEARAAHWPHLDPDIEMVRKSAPKR